MPEPVGGTETQRMACRLIVASNRDLSAEVARGRFRQDLFYRLNVIPIVIPSLRERRSDIPLLIEHFLRRFNHMKQTDVAGFAPDAIERMSAYDWPGNIRELENMVERLVVLKKRGQVTVADLPEKIQQKPVRPAEAKEQFIRFTEDGIHLSTEVEQFENQLIGEAMRKANGVTARAAQLLHVNRTTLVEKLKRKGQVRLFQ